MPVAYADGYTIFMSPTACHCPTTAADLVFWPSSSAPAAPNLTPPPLMLSPTATSTFSAAPRIESAVELEVTWLSTLLKNVQPPTNPATAGIVMLAPPLAAA